MGNKLVKVGGSLYVRPDDVIMIHKGRQGRAVIVLASGQEWEVPASVDDVVKALNDAR